MPERVFSLSEVASRNGRVEITSLAELDEDAHQRLSTSAMTVARLEPAATFDLVSRNMETLDGLQLLLARRAASETEGSFHLPQGHFFRLILAALANYLSSGRMHTDSTMDVLSAVHGKDSDLYREAKADWCELFDSSSGYRFTYHLRNAMQHIGTLPFSWRSVISDDPDERVQIFADRDRLLSEYRWPKPVRRDLLDGPPEVVFLPLLIEGYAGYAWHERRRIQRAMVAAQDDIQALHAGLSSLPDHEGAVILAELRRVDDSPGTGAILNSQTMPSVHRLDTILTALATDNFDRVLPIGYARRASSAQATDKDDPLNLWPALDLLDVAHLSGPSGVLSAVRDVVGAGPESAAATLVSLVNANMLSLTQLQMVHGQDVGAMLSGLRFSG